MATINLTVNGRAVRVTVANEETPLLAVLRDELHLVGTRFGCGLEQCGCCMVLLDGVPTKSCAKPVWSVAGKSVVTVEGLGTPERPHPLQQALLDAQAGQCGYCLTGIVMGAAALLARNLSPTEAEIRSELDIHLCRCGAYDRILRAIRRASEMIGKRGE